MKKQIPNNLKEGYLQKLFPERIPIKLERHRERFENQEEREEYLLKTSSVKIGRYLAERLVVEIKINKSTETANMIDLSFFEMQDILNKDAKIHRSLVRGIGILPETSKLYFSFGCEIADIPGPPFYCDALAFYCSEHVEIEVMVYGG